MFLFLAGFVGTVCFGTPNTSRAAPLAAGRGGGGFHEGRFAVRNGAPGMRMGRGLRDFAFHQGRFFHRRGRTFLPQQFVWPVYWNPYYYGSGYYPWDSSYLDYGPENDYSYGGGSAAHVQPDNSNRTATSGPLVIVINQGNQGNSKSSDNSHPEHAGTTGGANVAENTQRIVAQESNEQSVAHTDPSKFLSPAYMEAAQAVPQAPQAISQTKAGSSKFILVSWLNDGGKDAIFVRNVETNEVQRITSEPNRENFRIMEMHSNADPKEVEAIISNGREQIPVRFRF